MKRLVIISDLHCGHKLGMVPPSREGWQTTVVQKKLWKWYEKQAKALGPVDALVCNGDAIDGKSPKSGGNELITTDREEQVRMAMECINQFDAKKVYIIAGTPYHTGQEENFEKILADYLGARFDLAMSLDVNGCMFNFRHKISSSTVPHGRATALLREQLWTILGACVKENVKADVVVRSHVHYHVMAKTRFGLALTTPGLQLSSDFGTRICQGIIDVGFLYFDIKSREDYRWQELLVHEPFQVAPVEKI